MRDKYTYEQIKRATLMMLNEGHHYTIAQICTETGISEFRIRTWRKRWREIKSQPMLHLCNYTTLKFISNLTFGVSEQIWSDWLEAIDENIGRIEATEITCDIQRILEELAQDINERHPDERGVTQEMIERAVIYFVDKLRERRVQH